MTLSSIKSTPPMIGITMGDAAGIGPEVIVKSLLDRSLNQKVRPVVIGDAGILGNACKLLGAKCSVLEYSPKTRPSNDSIEVVDLQNLRSVPVTGAVSASAGKAAGEYIEKAVELWRNGIIHAICTAPINKESLALGGYDYPGHTEFLAELTGSKKFAMSFFADELRVVLLSTHMSLFEALQKVKKWAIVDLIRFTDRQLEMLLNKKIKIAVAGLNPHASENGKFGKEEDAEILPAISECSSEGIDVSGPFSPDTIFLRAHRGEFDAVIALYHDQATIPVKALSFGAAVNVTLGLPLIRTSVDHGTAFDIAGKGIADPSSMTAAILLAGELAGIAAKPRQDRV